MSNGLYGPEEAVSHIQKDVVSVHMSEQYESIFHAEPWSDEHVV